MKKKNESRQFIFHGDIGVKTFNAMMKKILAKI